MFSTLFSEIYRVETDFVITHSIITEKSDINMYEFIVYKNHMSDEDIKKNMRD